MTLRKSTTFDYTNKNFDMDFTNLQRLPTNTGIALIDRLNREANEQSEILEMLFVEIACDIMDNPDLDATLPFKKKNAPKQQRMKLWLQCEARTISEECGVVHPKDFFDDNGAENDVFAAKDEIVEVKNETDDFDDTDPRYLEILGEIV